MKRSYLKEVVSWNGDENDYLCFMRRKTVETITLVTRFIGVLFIIYITLSFGVLEKYNLRGIGTYDGYGLYWRCLVTCCLVFALDFIAQIIKLALPVSFWPSFFQAFLYLSSFVIVILISTNYPNLICDGDRHEYMLWVIEDQIKSARESVMLHSLYIGIRSLAYSVIFVKKLPMRVHETGPGHEEME